MEYHIGACHLATRGKKGGACGRTMCRRRAHVRITRRRRRLYYTMCASHVRNLSLLGLLCEQPWLVEHPHLLERVSHPLATGSRVQLAALPIELHVRGAHPQLSGNPLHFSGLIGCNSTLIMPIVLVER